VAALHHSSSLLRSRNGPFHATSAEPVSRRPVARHLFTDGPAAQTSRQLGSTEGGLVYASVEVWRAGLQQLSGLHKSPAKGSDHTEPAASSEVDTRHMSLKDMSRLLCGMPVGTTISAQVATSSAATAGEWQNKTPIYISGVTDTRGFLSWIRASCQSGISAQI
jgi:hypothetical protein